MQDTVNVDWDLCVECGWCIGYCDFGVFSLKTGGHLQCMGEKCVQCGQCLEICPRNAIMFK